MEEETKKQIQIEQFNPSGVGVKNGNFIGLPFDKETADILIFPVPWDVTVSYHEGTSNAPHNILDASYQLDLYLEHYPDFWKRGIYFIPPSQKIIKRNKKYRTLAKSYIDDLEKGKKIKDFTPLIKINNACQQLNEWVYKKTKKLIEKNKKVILLGGDHSTPLGYLKALAEHHQEFGIVQIDAHCDLRESYEGFVFSHASIFYNALHEIPQITHLSQVGIRDFCEEEMDFATQDERIFTYSDSYIKNSVYEGVLFHFVVKKIIKALPQKVYISFDIDGLDPKLCPNTGTPVPGGLSYSEALYILQQIKKSGKEIIGIDLCEVSGNHEFDANIGARILYQLSSLL